MAVLAHYGGSLEPFKAIVHQEMELVNLTVDPSIHSPGNSKYDSFIASAKNREAAILFLDNACEHRYTKLKNDLANQYAMKNNQYPISLHESYALLGSYIVEKPSTLHDISDSDSDNDTTKLNQALTFLNSVKPCPKCGTFHGKYKACPKSGASPPDKNDSKTTDIPKSAAIVQTNLHVDTNVSSKSNEDDIEEEFHLNFSLNTVGTICQQIYQP